MIIFVRNIGPNITVTDLKKFIESGMKSWIPFKSGKVHKAKILTLRNIKTNSYEYHGLVYVDNEYGKMAIRRLNRKKIKNRPVNVRQYIERSRSNDRRRSYINISHNDIDLIGQGNRFTDRRRGHHLEVVDQSIVKISAVESAYRKY